MAERTVHVRITGRVQGVGFRAWTRARATALRLSGWVRNTAAGDVEAVFSGDEGDVGAMLRECRQGPRGAAVIEVFVLAEPEPAHGPFRILTNR